MLQSTTHNTWVSAENKPVVSQPMTTLATANNHDRSIENTLWESLLSDTGCPVATLTPWGKIKQCNTPMAALLGCNTQSPTASISLADLLPAEVAHEQLTLIQQALDTKEPVAVEGMLHGTMLQTIYRAVPAEPDHVGFVLMVCSLVLTGEGTHRNLQTRRATHDDAGAIAALTNREREILQYIGMGMTTAQIADKLHRSVKTVEGHRVSLGIKLNVRNRVQLARIAIQAGLSPLPLSAIEPKPFSTAPISQPTSPLE